MAPWIFRPSSVSLSEDSGEYAVVVIAVHLADQAARPLAQRRRFLHHALGFLPDDLRLVALGRNGIDLRPRFAIRQL